jgi:NAD(P)H-hydrate epimerase
MATAGSGDMLSGITVALLAQGLVAEIASVCAVKIHAMAGDEALKNSSVLSLTPSDMIDFLPTIYNRLYFKK